jgi:hypothetical protein
MQNHAKSIIRVIVMSKSSTEDRYRMLMVSLDNIARITGNDTNHDFSSFNFLFTNSTESCSKRLLIKYSDSKTKLTRNEADDKLPRNLQAITVGIERDFFNHEYDKVDKGVDR